MALESKPNSPLAMKFPPLGGTPYSVKSGDNWGSVANRFSIDTWALIEFNFPAVKGTADFQKKCRQVNWMLRTHVGCTNTPDGKNYAFSSSDSPGRIYVPAAAPPAPPASKPRFESAAKNQGFDQTITPRWQMVPEGGTRIIRVMNAHGLDVVSVRSNIVTVTEINKCFVHGGREFRLQGLRDGRTFVEVRHGTSVRARLEVDVKTEKPVKVTFHFVSDNAGHKTTRSSNDVDTWVSKASKILQTQANVVVQKHNVRPNVKINKNLGSVVRFSSHLNGVAASEHEWDDVTAKADSTADLNVFFVWEYEQDATPNTDNTAAGTSGGNCIFEDKISRQTHDTLAHEIGHFLGVSHAASGGDLLMSPHRTDTRISKSHANQMNP